MRRLLLLLAPALCLVGCATIPAHVSAPPVTSGPVDQSPSSEYLVKPDASASAVDKAAGAIAYADAAVDHAWSFYSALRDTARLVLPYLSADRQARVLALEDTIEASFAKARAAADLAARAAALASAAQSVQKLESLTIDPD